MTVELDNQLITRPGDVPMRWCARNLFISYLLTLVVFARPAAGEEIFHWVDEDGVLTFSDWAPEDNSVEVSKVVVADSNPPDYDPDEDPNSILDQAKRINHIWEELKEEKEERREERLERQREAGYRVPVEYDPYYASSPYFFRPVHPFGFQPIRPFKTQKRQAVALDRLGLLGGPRPHSINSSAHLERVNAGMSFIPAIRLHRSGKAQ